ncbi:MAG TPA: cyclopropane mycolic acid synthase family methyltransferase [Planctomycetaceae bacterium]|nr:cyclopropane mycolic acid synthase family methyltransferase [Planctomycetaceae bacterium]
MRRETAMPPLEPFYQQVQAHYDLSNEFFALFLDPSLTYSCAFFERDGMSLEEAQRAKIDRTLGKCDLRRGQRLLDIGCGWGATVRRAVEAFGVQATGLTLSQKQCELARERLADLGGRADVRLQGWEEFDEPVDRIVSIGAFEHFREERYPAFFEKCRRLLPADGRLLLHTIVWLDPEELAGRGLEIGFEDVQFLKFIGRRIFPGGQLRPPSVIRGHAEAAGFAVTQVEALRPHYARTLEAWAGNLQAARDRAIELTSDEVYETYRHYLTGCARYFREGFLDVMQFTCSCREAAEGRSV